MGYTLEALLLDSVASQKPRTVRGVDLLQGITLIPLTDEVIDGLPETHEATDIQEAFWKLNGAVEALIRMLSAPGRIAYVEVDYFGGTGTQAAAVWEAGAVTLGPIHSQGPGAVNEALQFLGVIRGNALDEFDAVDLSNSGRNRNTASWLELIEEGA